MDTVYLGEVVCSKRQPFLEKHFAEVTERLSGAGKEVVFSSLALVMNKRERQLVRDLCAEKDLMIEANDMSAAAHLAGRPHAIGPFINVYNEDTLSFLNRKGANIFCLPQELPAERIAVLAAHAKKLGVQTEVQVYGRVPLALSARCYHARAHGLAKDNCQFVCKEDPDGMELDTLEDQHFMTVNGIQTMSYTCLNLAGHLAALEEMGVTRFRLSPQNCDMVEVARIFRQCLEKEIDSSEANNMLAVSGLDAPFSDGFLAATCGHMQSL